MGELQHRLFRLAGNPDGQLLLALVIYLTAAQRRRRTRGEEVVGVTSFELFDYLSTHREPGAIHASIDGTWASPYEVQRALGRLRRLGYTRGGPIYEGDPSVWRPTDAGNEFLGSRLLFPVEEWERRQRAKRRRDAA